MEFRIGFGRFLIGKRERETERERVRAHSFKRMDGAAHRTGREDCSRPKSQAKQSKDRETREERRQKRDKRREKREERAEIKGERE